MPAKAQKGWFVLRRVAGDGWPRHREERDLRVQGNALMTNLVVSFGPKGHLLDSATDRDAKLPHLAEELLHEGAVLLAPCYGVDAADRAADGDRPLSWPYSAEPLHGVNVPPISSGGTM